MARQRKSLEEQINGLNEQISKVQCKLDSLLEQKDVLLTRKREEEIGELYELILNKGMSVQDVYNLLGDCEDDAGAEEIIAEQIIAEQHTA